MTTDQNTIEGTTTTGRLQTATDNTRQALTTARTRATTAVRQNPKKSATATTLVLAAAAAATVLLARRRSTRAKAQSRSRLAQLLHR